MILLETIVDGFGCLVKQHFTFAEGLTIIAGPNESGKTTLTECIVRLLFGYPEHQYGAALEQRRPWHWNRYAATLVYRLDDGRVLETRRDFGQNHVPTETYERPVMRKIDELSGSRKASPGAELLHLSMEAFAAAAVMRAGEFAGGTDAKSYQALAERIAELVGAAGEAGAQQAIDRLNDFIARDLGSDRAPKKPLSLARAETEAARAALKTFHDEGARMRENLERRAQLLGRQSALAAQIDALDATRQAMRLAALRARIAAAERAARQVDEASHKRASGMPSPEIVARRQGIDAAIDAWLTARTAERDASSSSQAKEEQRSSLLRQIAECDAKIKDAESTVNSRGEAIERLKPEAGRGAISDETLERLEQLSELADIQEHAARTKETQTAINRQRPRAGAWPAVSIFIIALIALIAGALAHLLGLVLAGIAGIVASGVMFGYLFVAERNKAAANAALEDEAKQARTVASSAAANLSKEVTALGLSDIRAARRAAKVQGEIVHFNESLESAKRSAAQNRELRDSLEARFNDFSQLDKQLVDARARTEEAAAQLRRLLDEAGVPGGDLEPRIAGYREARLDTEDALLADKAVSDAKAELAGALGGDTLDSLKAQEQRLAATVGAAAASAQDADPAALETKLKALNDEKPGIEGELGRLNSELARFDEQYRDGGAPLEERLAACEAEEARLSSAREAATIAREVIEQTKDHVHKNFAPHLNSLAGPALKEITHGRYTEVMVDPKDFSLQVRTGADSGTVGMSVLSAGTQEQLHLSLRAATAQALGGDGSDECVPLLLDDALAHADERRLAAAVRHLAAIAKRQQILLFTQRDTVLEAARELEDVTILHLSGPPPAGRT
ncbi:MAG: AAA family ATPase [Candidatus Eremiobacteraeota bacterium]|nr:AAA family ATPase [Candidatus Eremiobacteraeota bacterium]